MENDFLARFPLERITFDIPVGPKAAVIRGLLDLAVRGLDLSEEQYQELYQAVLRREDAGSTGVGCVAIPHVRSPWIRETVAALGVFKRGVDFEAVDGEQVYSVFLVLSHEDAAAEHVRFLRQVASVARKKDYTLFVRQAKTPEEVHGLLQEMGS